MGQVWPKPRGSGKSSVFLGLTRLLVGGSPAFARALLIQGCPACPLLQRRVVGGFG